MKTIVFTTSFMLCVLFGYSQTLVSYDKKKDVDFSTYKTYQIYDLDITNIPEFEPKKFGIDLLTEEIDKQMTARGYKKVSENPDLIINLGITITKEVQTRESDIRDAPRYMGQRNYHWESGEVVVRRYTEGTVTFDLVDANKNEMIWQAVSSGILAKKREKNKKRIIKAAQKLFKKYPVSTLTK